MCTELSPWDEAVVFHGHSCPGLAIGYRVATIALRELGVHKSSDEELVAIVENDSCSVDAIQVLTGCTFGKGNLIFHDYGKQVYTIGNRKTGEAVRIALKSSALKRTSEDRLQRIHDLLHISEEEFCSFQKAAMELPAKARIYKSVQCEACGESVAEPKARVKEGKIVCIPCSEAK